MGNDHKIVDGDTVHIGAITYRLNLIDTPERGEEGFWEASNALKELCPKDSAILYDEDSITELAKYGRHLGVIWCKGNNYSATAGEWLSDNGLLKNSTLNTVPPQRPHQRCGLQHMTTGFIMMCVTRKR